MDFIFGGIWRPSGARAAGVASCNIWRPLLLFLVYKDSLGTPETAGRRRNAPPRETTMGVAVVGDVIGREICIMKTTLQASELATCRRTLKKHRHPLRRPETFTLLIIVRTRRMAHTIKHAHERSRLIAGCQSSIQLDSSKCIFYPTRRSTPNKTKRIPLLNLRQRLSSNS